MELACLGVPVEVLKAISAPPPAFRLCALLGDLGLEKMLLLISFLQSP
jgi:hypothetical protein